MASGNCFEKSAALNSLFSCNFKNVASEDMSKLKCIHQAILKLWKLLKLRFATTRKISTNFRQKIEKISADLIRFPP